MWSHHTSSRNLGTARQWALQNSIRKVESDIMQTQRTLRIVAAYSPEPTRTEHDPLVRLDVLQVASAQSAA